jgi:hypothetical protein
MAELAELRLDSFTQLADQAFTVVSPEPAAEGDGSGAGASPLELRLAECDALGEPVTAGGRRPFSLLFTGPREPILRQAIHRLDHPELGAVELFLVPLAPDGAGARYEAVFN